MGARVQCTAAQTIRRSMTLLVGTDAMAFPSPALIASKSDCDNTPFASMPSMALTWAIAASLRAAPSMAAPITIILSTAFITVWGVAPGMGFRAKSEVQSTSLMSGYAAAASLLAAGPMEPPETVDAGVDAVIGLALTTPAKSTNAAYAAFASASFTVDIKYSGTLESTKAPTEL